MRQLSAKQKSKATPKSSVKRKSKTIPGQTAKRRPAADAVRKDEQKKAQEILRHLLESSDRQRHLISCEIHDGLAQELAGAIMQFQAYRSFQRTNPKRAAKAFDLGMQLLRQGNAEARRLIEGLRRCAWMRRASSALSRIS